jgi:hypothetical protein
VETFYKVSVYPVEAFLALGIVGIYPHTPFRQDLLVRDG